MSLLEITNLSLSILGTDILKDISLNVEAGKSMTALAVMQLLPENAKTSGSVRLEETDLLTAYEAQMCAIRGSAAGMVFQEPMTALNPLKTIGDQVAETVLMHDTMPPAKAKELARDMLARVGLPSDRFPCRAIRTNLAVVSVSGW